MGRDRFEIGARRRVATQEWDGALKLRPEAQTARAPPVGRARADHAATSEASAEPAAARAARDGGRGALVEHVPPSRPAATGQRDRRDRARPRA